VLRNWAGCWLSNTALFDFVYPIKGGDAMFVKQKELLWGLGHDFVKEFMEKVEKVTVDPGQNLFLEGDPADYFYTLVSGRIKLKVGEEGRTVFIINHAGEAFGWSSLVDREVYSASAECSELTTVTKIDRDDFWNICTKYPSDGLVFMKRMAGLLGQRLLVVYETQNLAKESHEYDSYGTSQVMEAVLEE
jgi:CRP-like cAMP-binding protein